MNYKLVIKLRDLGFPQHKYEDHTKACLERANMEVCFPTLSELIEACGEKFDKLINLNLDCEEKKLAKKIFDNDDNWQAMSYSRTVTGKTPEEAVAKLWLELNKKHE